MDEWSVVQEQDEWSVVPDKKDEGFFSRVADDASKRLDNVSKNYSPIFLEQQLRTGGQVAGFAGDVIGQGLRSAYRTMFDPESREIIESNVSNAIKPIMPAVKKIAEGYGSFKESFPNVATDLEAVGNIATMMPIGKGAYVGAKAVSPSVGKVAGAAADALEGIGSRQVAKLIPEESAERLAREGITEVDYNILQYTKRKFSAMTKSEQVSAVGSNKVSKPGLFKDPEIKNTPKDIEIAKSVEGIVDPKKNAIENIDNIHNEIGALAEKTQALPKQYDQPINVDDLKNALGMAKNNRENIILMAGDATLERAYDTVVDDFVKVLSGKQNTLSSVLETRKEYDRLLKNIDKHAFDNTGSVKKQAAKDIRTAANDFVAEHLPDGNEFKALLKRQSNMYRAADNIALNAVPAINKGQFSKLLDAIKTHPFISTEVAAGALGGAAHFGLGGVIASAITNPAAIMALGLYGTYRVGKAVVTSDTIRAGLIKFLRATENTLSPAEKRAVNNVILHLPRGGQDFIFKGDPLPTQKAHIVKEAKQISQYPNKPDYIDVEFNARNVPLLDASNVGDNFVLQGASKISYPTLSSDVNKMFRGTREVRKKL